MHAERQLGMLSFGGQAMAGQKKRCACLILCVSVVAFPAVARAGTDAYYPGGQWEAVLPREVGMDPARLASARDYALTGEGSGLITRHGKVVMLWGDQQQTYDLKSSTKAIGVTAVGLALMDGRFNSLSEPASKHHPSLGVPPETNMGSGWLARITLLHLATQTAGFDKPGGYTALLFEPGTKWSYSDGGPNWLAECVTLAYGRDVQELMFERVFSPIGIGRDDLRWRANSYRPKDLAGVPRREFGSGISANVDAMARIGYLYLRSGLWEGMQILPAWFVDAVRTVPYGVRGLPVLRPEDYGNASDHYGLLWWNNADGTMKEVPRDTYWSWGLYDSLIVVIPSLDIVVARAGKSFPGTRSPHYAPIEPFIGPIAGSVTDRGKWPGAPYPLSGPIREVTWSPIETVIRQAEGRRQAQPGLCEDRRGPRGFHRRQHPQRDRRAGRAGPSRPQGQRHALCQRRLVHAGPEHRQLATRLVRGPRAHMAVVRLAIQDELRGAHVPQLRQGLRRCERQLRLPLLARQ